MCEEFKVDLLANIPIDPELLQASDTGKCYVKEYPEKLTSKCFMKVANDLILKTKNEK